MDQFQVSFKHCPVISIQIKAQTRHTVLFLSGQFASKDLHFGGPQNKERAKKKSTGI
jgi:hypothetical protein